MEVNFKLIVHSLGIVLYFITQHIMGKTKRAKIKSVQVDADQI